MWLLTVEDDEGSITHHRLVRDVYRFGRALDNEVVLEQRNIARHHATLERTAKNLWMLVDQSTLNGCYVNGERVQDRTILSSLDVVRLGDYQLTLTSDGVDTQVPTPPPKMVQPARLVVMTGANAGTVRLLGARQRIKIGRQDDCELRFLHPSVSAVHALVEPLPQGGYEIADYGSKNGLVINDRRYARKVLEGGDTLEVGDGIRVRFFDRQQLADPRYDTPTPPLPLGVPRRPTLKPDDHLHDPSESKPDSARKRRTLLGVETTESSGVISPRTPRPPIVVPTSTAPPELGAELQGFMADHDETEPPPVETIEKPVVETDPVAAIESNVSDRTTEPTPEPAAAPEEPTPPEPAPCAAPVVPAKSTKVDAYEQQLLTALASDRRDSSHTVMFEPLEPYEEPEPDDEPAQHPLAHLLEAPTAPGGVTIETGAFSTPPPNAWPPVPVVPTPEARDEGRNPWLLIVGFLSVVVLTGVVVWVLRGLFDDVTSQHGPTGSATVGATTAGAPPPPSASSGAMESPRPSAAASSSGAPALSARPRAQTGKQPPQKNEKPNRDQRTSDCQEWGNCPLLKEQIEGNDFNTRKFHTQAMVSKRLLRRGLSARLTVAAEATLVWCNRDAQVELHAGSTDHYDANARPAGAGAARASIATFSAWPTFCDGGVSANSYTFRCRPTARCGISVGWNKARIFTGRRIHCTGRTFSCLASHNSCAALTTFQRRGLKRSIHRSFCYQKGNAGASTKASFCTFAALATTSTFLDAIIGDRRSARLLARGLG